MRKSNWEYEFVIFMEEIKTKPFKWGDNDCALFVSGIVKAITDIDMEDGIRGSYSSEKEAQVLIETFGKGSLLKVGNKFAKKYGFRKIPILSAMRGDAVMAKVDGILFFGVCIGQQLALITSPGKFAIHPMSAAKTAWRIE